MARLDPHSYADSDQPDVTSFDWSARIDFAAHVLEAEATLVLSRPGEGPLDLDTRDLQIAAVTNDEGRPIPWELAAPEPVLGARLRVGMPAGTQSVRVRYRTSPEASALQWLSPAQTSGGVEPFLFSQCQAIHARSLLPLQDTPRVRVRFRAQLTVPARLRALMAAAFVARELKGDLAVETWEMPQSIPPYLLALAVGDLAFREIGPRTRVWAEPGVVERSAWEFAQLEDVLRAAEALFGAYEWERYDVLVMPPSFPYGGMENPRLSFLTPAIVAGDRSAISVVFHELAHSWTGNLVTNASMDHFWLNEGFTVFAERRIQEAIEGPEMTALHAALGRRNLERAVDRFKDRPEVTRLRTHLEGVDPDEIFSEIPYEKGYLFLRTLEEAIGKDAFTAFLRRYIRTFRFRSITTEDFVAFVERELPGALARVDGDAWLNGPGIPANAPAAASARLETIEGLRGALPPVELGRGFTPTEWQLYLEAVPRPAPRETLEALDHDHNLTASKNYDVLVTWLVLAAESGYERTLARTEAVLGEIGRMKYLRPLYRALAGREETRELARRTYAQHRDAYHPIARQVVEGLLK